jgi:hypothetical protein
LSSGPDGSADIGTAGYNVSVTFFRFHLSTLLALQLRPHPPPLAYLRSMLHPPSLPPTTTIILYSLTLTHS